MQTRTLTVDHLRVYSELAQDIAKPKRTVDVNVRAFYSEGVEVFSVTQDWDDTGYYGCLYRLTVIWETLQSNGGQFSTIVEIVESSWQDALMKDPTLIDKLIEDDEESTTYRGVGRGNE